MQATECCYLDRDGDIFMRERNGNAYRWYPRENFISAAEATRHIGRKPGMDPQRVGAMCRIAFGETTPEQEGVDPTEIYRTLEELGQR